MASKAAAILCLTVFLTSVTSTAFATGTPANPAPGSTFDQRLAQRKAEQNEQLDTQTQLHIQQTCIIGQGHIRQLQTNATTMANNRTTTYQKIDGIILMSIGELKLASLDTFTLEQNRTTLVQKMSAFEATASNYQQTLGDLLVINCKADPVGYQALLDTARYYYKQLGVQSADISSYTVNTVQPVIQNFITQLQPKSSTGGQ